jgi:hypothetical protein
MEIGTNMLISDLDIAKNPNIEIQSPLDTLVFSITESRKTVDLPETEDEESESGEEAGAQTE